MLGLSTPCAVPCPRSTCQGGRWLCTQDRCAAECAVLGDLHYITFDRRRFSFPGACEYTLVQVWGCRAGGCGGGTRGSGCSLPTGLRGGDAADHSGAGGVRWPPAPQLPPGALHHSAGGLSPPAQHRLPQVGQGGGHRAGSTLPLHPFLHPTQERWWWTGAWCRCPLPVLR